MSRRSRKKMVIVASYFKDGSYGLLGPHRIQQTISIYGLPRDILPPHSTPLIIHHASGLGDWIREVERRERLRFKRFGSIIGGWETKPQRCA